MVVCELKIEEIKNAEIMGYDVLKYSNRSAGFAALREDINRELTRTDANGNAYLSVELL